MELTMSMFATKADYWEARAELAERTLTEIADRFGIGEQVRTAGVILENVENAARRSRCLSMIEAHHVVTVLDDDGEEIEEQLLNWGEEPEQYIETYKAVVTPNAEVSGAGTASAGLTGYDRRNWSENMTEKRTVWVAYTNTDCNEGRGRDVPIAVCAAEATAMRLARKQYVQGSDGPVRTMELVNIDGQWYAPGPCYTIETPTREDIAAQAAIDAKRTATEKAKAAGLTDDDLRALGLRA